MTENIKRNLLLILVSLTLGVAGIACEGLAGPDDTEGPPGPEGPMGPVGPSGKDGTQLYAGEDGPDEGLGTDGDFYLNQNTGELYGPKDPEEGWGSPFMVLAGQDGKDGADGRDGKDGKDGKDGNLILSGNGPPKEDQGIIGDYYLDTGSYELYGPKYYFPPILGQPGFISWGTPVALKGSPGSANVTRYIFPGHNFRTDGTSKRYNFEDYLTSSEFRNSVWLIYLVDIYMYEYYPIPGHTEKNIYDHYDYTIRGGFERREIDVYLNVGLGTVNGDYFHLIEFVRIEIGETIDKAKAPSNIIPADLDVSDYNAVAEYYGF